jgi:SAM-dependent methyltransferase
MLVSIDALRTIREAELRAVLPGFPANGRVLEIGGGSGWQAARLAAIGYAVESVDLASNPYLRAQEWPVRIYDGQSLPFPAESFDAVFSSNVLEHVVNLKQLMREAARVVKPGGVAIHLMPTPLWRLLTLLAHYPWLVRIAIGRMRGNAESARIQASARGRSPGWILRRLVCAERHGEEGTALGEIWSFRRRRWIAGLSDQGWKYESDWGAGILYSGYFNCHPWLVLRRRQQLARFLGSSCRAYKLRRTDG